MAINKPLHWRIDDAIVEKFKSVCKDKCTNPADLVKKFMEEYIKENDKMTSEYLEGKKWGELTKEQ